MHRIHEGAQKVHRMHHIYTYYKYILVITYLLVTRGATRVPQNIYTQVHINRHKFLLHLHTNASIHPTTHTNTTHLYTHLETSVLPIYLSFF